MLELTSQEKIVYEMIVKAAQQGRPCPSNLDIEMEVGCNSSSIPPGIVKRLEDKGYIKVIRFQRAREVFINATAQKTARHPDRKTERPHIARGEAGHQGAPT